MLLRIGFVSVSQNLGSSWPRDGSFSACAPYRLGICALDTLPPGVAGVLLGGWTVLGYFADNVSTHASLGDSSVLQGGTSNVTIEICLNACHSQGYPFALGIVLGMLL